MSYTLIDGKSFADNLVMKVADAVNVLYTKHQIKPGRSPDFQSIVFLRYEISLRDHRARDFAENIYRSFSLRAQACARFNFK